MRLCMCMCLYMLGELTKRQPNEIPIDDTTRLREGVAVGHLQPYHFFEHLRNNPERTQNVFIIWRGKMGRNLCKLIW